MSFLEYGSLNGLAVRNNYDADMDRALQLKQMQRQAHIDAQNKAKLFGDIQYGSSLNKWDAGKIDVTTNKLTGELGKFATENPNFDADPMKMVEFNRMKQSFLNNSDVQRGMRVDANKKALDAYALKNPDAMDELAPYYAQYKNYENTGTADVSMASQQEFQFIPPEDKFDSDKYLRDAAGKVHQTGYEPYGQNIDGYRQFVADTDKTQFANAILSSTEGKHFIRTWKDMSKDQQSQYKDIQDWVNKSSELYMPADKIEIGRTPRMAGKGTTTDASNSPYQDALLLAQKNPGTPIQASAEGVKRMLTDNNGKFNLDGVEVVGTRGNRTPMNLGIVSNAYSSGSKIVYFPSGTRPGEGKYYASITVQMTPDEFESKVASGAIDKPTPGTGWMGNDLDFHSNFKEKTEGASGFKITKDEKDNDIVEFNVWKPIDNNVSLAAQYNGGTGGEKEKFTSQQAQQRIGKDEAGKLWILDDNNQPIAPYQQ